MTEIGELLRELRGKMSLRQASQKIGISHVHLDNIEKGYDRRSGKQVHPSVATIQLLAKGYDYPYKELMKAAGYWNEEDEKQEQFEKEKEEFREKHGMNELSEETREFARRYESLTQEQKDEIERILEWEEFKKSRGE